jgi:hypothetical protein
MALPPLPIERLDPRAECLCPDCLRVEIAQEKAAP